MSSDKKFKDESNRLQGYDYSSPGFYFVTIVVQDRACHFGKIEDDVVILSDIGRIANECWMAIPTHFPHAKLHEFVIMPNHVHGIIEIVLNEHHPYNVGAKNFSPLHYTKQKFESPSKTIGSIIRGFKIGVTKWCRNNDHDYFAWQPNFHDRIIRNDHELNRIGQYIIKNPNKWDGSD